VRQARQAGFDSIWAGQHFLADPMTMFQPIPLLGLLAADADGMTLGTNILVLPLLNPVQVAEEAATLAEEALGLLTDEPDTADSELLRGLSHSLLAHALWFRDEQAGASAAREAIRLLEQLISTHREHPDIGSAFVEIAWAHTSLGHHHRAIELCREHLRAEQDPGYRLQSLITMAEALRNIGRLREAEDTLTQALECSHADPLTRPLLYVTQGLIRQGMQQPASALESFERALHALRDHPLEVRDQEILKTIYGNLAELHYANANLREAIGALKQLLIQYNDDGEDRHRILNWLGTCQATIGAAGEARRCFEEVLASPLVNDVEKTEAKDGLTRLTRPKGRM